VTALLVVNMILPLQHKYGRKLLVYLSTGLMALMMGVLMLVSLKFPYLYGVAACGAMFGVGYGAFLAVDWALALDSLPPEADTAKDMGIWHIAFVFPQVVAPIISGTIITMLKARSVNQAYAAVFAISCLWFVLSTVFVSCVSTKKSVHN